MKDVPEHPHLRRAVCVIEPVRWVFGPKQGGTAMRNRPCGRTRAFFYFQIPTRKEFFEC